MAFPPSGKTPEALILRSLVLAGILSALKAVTGALGGSLGVMASALDSIMDLGASSLNLASLRLARLPPDAEHPYGQGKAESLAGLVQGSLIALASLILLKEAWNRYLEGRSPDFGYAGIAVMVLSAATSFWHERRLKEAVTREASEILEAERAHFAADFLSNLSIAAALAASAATGQVLWDLGLSAVVSLLVLREAARLLFRSIGELTDRRLPQATVLDIERAIRGHDPRVVGFHELRTRRSGPRVFVDFHIEIRGVSDFSEAHEITEGLIDRIRREIPNADVTVHYDPEGAR